MNRKIIGTNLVSLISTSHAYGSAVGKEAFQKLAGWMDVNPKSKMFGISLQGIELMDAAFARESFIALAKLKRGRQGLFLVDLESDDIRDNIDYAAKALEQPLTVWEGKEAILIGSDMARSTSELIWALHSSITATAAQVAALLEISVQNASTKLKRLVELGYLLREEEIAESGGIEYRYRLIGEPH